MDALNKIANTLQDMETMAHGHASLVFDLDHSTRSLRVSLACPTYGRRVEAVSRASLVDSPDDHNRPTRILDDILFGVRLDMTRAALAHDPTKPDLRHRTEPYSPQTQKGL